MSLIVLSLVIGADLRREPARRCQVHRHYF